MVIHPETKFSEKNSPIWVVRIVALSTNCQEQRAPDQVSRLDNTINEERILVENKPGEGDRGYVLILHREPKYLSYSRL
jgi:hypothetical protein